MDHFSGAGSILLAIEAKGLTDFSIRASGGEMSEPGGEVGSWNLHADDLTAQSDETLAFLADLLT